MKRGAALSLVVAGAIGSIVSLLIPWFRHDQTLGRIRTRITLTPVLDESCSNFARDAFECRSRLLATDDTWQLLYGSFVKWSTVTAIAAVFTVIASLALIALGSRDDAIARSVRRWTWASGAALAIGTLVTLGRMPRDPRTESLSVLAGGPVALAAAVAVLVGIALLARAAGSPLRAVVWLVPVGALLVVGGSLHPAWREQKGDVGSREIGLGVERFCGTNRVGCSFRSYEPIEDTAGSSRRDDARRLGLLAAHAGPIAAFLALLALGYSLEDKLRTGTSTIAWIAALATFAFAVLGGMFLFHEGYSREYGPSVGALIGIAGIVVTFGSLAWLSHDE